MNYNDVKKIIYKVLSKETELAESEINEETSFEELGIESVMMLSITRKLEEYFGELPKTLFFEYDNLKQLIHYLCESKNITELKDVSDTTYGKSKPENSYDNNDSRMLSQPIVEGSYSKTENPEKTGVIDGFIKQISTHSKMHIDRKEDSPVDSSKDYIAIIGMSGRFADARNIEEFYYNLRNGKDSVREIPKERWDWSECFSTKENLKPGETYSRWGGYMDDIDKFDPLFFNISNQEAKGLDPQERIFLETAVETLEDSGYTPKSLDKEKLGVFVGVMWGQYQLYGADDAETGSSYASVANRVSYFLNAHGPSLAVDTMCSSSLTSLHLACKSILNGESSIALAGGVNITVHPNKYLYLSKTGFASTDGKCRSFGIDGDGYVPGDGSGAVLLKKLEQAKKDGDHIYGVILASGLNHGGKTRGYTVPNLESQYELINSTLNEAKVSPTDISYMEMHGTGTSLGDPIEIRSMGKNFSDAYDSKIPIGSVKSNIGHLESAAGIAGLIKVLLQIRNKELFPSLHSSTLNPNINFESTPFYVNQKLSKWEVQEGRKRIASISAFGAGGSNAYIVVEEYNEQSRENVIDQKLYFPLSATSTDQLKESAINIANYLLNFTTQVKEKFDEKYNRKVDSFYSLCKYDKNIIDNETTLQDLELDPKEVLLLLGFSTTPSFSQTTTVDEIKQILDNERSAKISNAMNNKLIDTAYTLEYGRNHYGFRCLIESSTYDEFIFKLNHLNENEIVKIRRNQKIDDNYIKQLELNGNFKVLRKLWLSGLPTMLQNYSNYEVRRTSLPTYPFLKDSCWFDKGIKRGTLTPVKYNPQLERKEFLRIASKNYHKVVSNSELKSNNIEIIKSDSDCCFVRFSTSLAPLEILSKLSYIINQLDWKINDFSDVVINGTLSNFLYLECNEEKLTSFLLFNEKILEQNAVNTVDFVKNQTSGYTLRSRKVLGKRVGKSERFNFSWEKIDSNIRLEKSIISSIIQRLYTAQNNCIVYDFSNLGKKDYHDDIEKYKKEQALLVSLLQTTIKENKGFFDTLIIKIDKRYESYFSFLQGIVRALNKEVSNSQIYIIKTISENSDLMIPIMNTGGIFNLNNNELLEEVLEKDSTILPQIGDSRISSGTFVLIGGSGAVGRLLTKSLKDNGEHSIIWFGRKDINSVNIPKDIEYVQCDISDFENLKLNLQNVVSKFGSITSIWNLAMDFDIKRVLNLQESDIMNSLNIRVTGSLNLLKAIDDLNVGSILFFSSAEAYIGNSGWGLYSASCLEMNKLILDYVKLNSLGATVSIINWGFWKNKDDSVNNSLKKRGIFPIDESIGLSIINYVLNNKVEELTVMRISKEVSDRINVHSDESGSTGGEENVSYIHQKLVKNVSSDDVLKVFSDVLAIPLERLEIDRDIASFGVDSIMLSTLTKEFKRIFPTFEERILIENSTISEITQELQHLKAPVTTIDIADRARPGDGSSILKEVLRIFSKTLDITSDRLDVDNDIASFGVDSIMLSTLTKEFEKAFPEFEERILVENNTIREISQQLSPSSTKDNNLAIKMLDRISEDDSITDFLLNYHLNFKNNEGRGEAIAKFTDYLNTDLKRYSVIKKEKFDIEVIERGEGEALLFIPAIGLTAPIFINQFLKLSNNYRVICIHAPGYGISSSTKQPDNDKLSELYAEVLGKMDITKVNIVASCFGSILGATLAFKYPDLVNKLVLVGGFYDGRDIQKMGSNNRNIINSVNKVSESIGKDFDNLVNKNLHKDVDQLLYNKELLLNAACSNPLYAIRYLNELSEFSTEEYLKNMQVATLLIYGTEDTIISNKRSQEMDEMLPNSQVFTMLNQGHYPYLTAPEEFNTVISNFFKED